MKALNCNFWRSNDWKGQFLLPFCQVHEKISNQAVSIVGRCQGRRVSVVVKQTLQIPSEPSGRRQTAGITHTIAGTFLYCFCHSSISNLFMKSCKPALTRDREDYTRLNKFVLEPLSMYEHRGEVKLATITIV